MARISRADHQSILNAIDVEHRKIADVAAEYGCTPAAIYALLGKLRRADAKAAVALPVTEPAEAAPKPDLFAAAALPEPEPAPAQPNPPPRVELSPSTVSANVTQLLRPAPPAGRSGLGAKLAKPGYGLVMRASEAEDSMTPFRSLDDLLSVIKPILRSAARNPDPVWFSIQQVDLATLDSDAA